MDDGAGGAATAYLNTKRQKYADLIDYERYEFVLFILEVQGDIGDNATNFISELMKRKRQRLAVLSRSLSHSWFR